MKNLQISEQKLPLLVVGSVLILVLLITAVSLLIALPLNRGGSTASSNDFTISITRGPCFGFCPAYTLKITAKGDAIYTGESNTAVDGQTIDYRVDKDDVGKLVAKVEELGFFNLKDRYENKFVTDLPSQEITVVSNGKTKTIYMYGLDDDIPEGLNDLAELIDEIGNADSYSYNTEDSIEPAEPY